MTTTMITTNMPHPLFSIPPDVHTVLFRSRSMRALTLEHAMFGVLGDDEATVGYELESRGWEGAQSERFAPAIRWLCAVRAEHLAWRAAIASSATR